MLFNRELKISREFVYTSKVYCFSVASHCNALIIHGIIQEITVSWILRKYWTSNGAIWLVDFSYWPSGCLRCVINTIMTHDEDKSYPIKTVCECEIVYLSHEPAPCYSWTIVCSCVWLCQLHLWLMKTLLPLSYEKVKQRISLHNEPSGLSGQSLFQCHEAWSN